VQSTPGGRNFSTQVPQSAVVLIVGTGLLNILGHRRLTTSYLFSNPRHVLAPTARTTTSPAYITIDTDYSCITRHSTSTMSNSTDMGPPPPPLSCAFGTACTLRPGGQEKGRDICSWCKNFSFSVLKQRANLHPEKPTLLNLIADYQKQITEFESERKRNHWNHHLCACRDPNYSKLSWRRKFHPGDSQPCSYVYHRGQLCGRCFTKAKEQGCSWLEEFTDDRYDFPCVFEDRQLMNKCHQPWRKGRSVGSSGKPDVDWEYDRDNRYHEPHERLKKRYHLCVPCFTRMNELAGFRNYFDVDHGELRQRFRPKE
jgi:hypothetical protein